MEQIKTFSDLTEFLANSERKKLAVANALDAHTLEAVMRSVEAGFIDACLVGKKEKVAELLKREFGKKVEQYSRFLNIVDCEDDARIATEKAVLMVRNGAGEVADISAWAGLGRRHPWMAAAMTLFLCSLAGIPLTAGFIGKLDAFVVAWRGGLWWLVICGLVFSLVAMVFYMRIVMVMWTKHPAAGDADPVTARPSITVACLLGLCAAGTLVAGVAPDLFMHWASLAGQLLR